MITTEPYLCVQLSWILEEGVLKPALLFQLFGAWWLLAVAGRGPSQTYGSLKEGSFQGCMSGVLGVSMVHCPVFQVSNKILLNKGVTTFLNHNI